MQKLVKQEDYNYREFTKEVLLDLKCQNGNQLEEKLIQKEKDLDVNLHNNQKNNNNQEVHNKLKNQNYHLFNM